VLVAVFVLVMTLGSGQVVASASSENAITATPQESAWLLGANSYMRSVQGAISDSLNILADDYKLSRILEGSSGYKSQLVKKLVMARVCETRLMNRGAVPSKRVGAVRATWRAACRKYGSGVDLLVMGIDNRDIAVITRGLKSLAAGLDTYEKGARQMERLIS
jgi:hypothetical protein